jgi:DNA-binding NarL/FixJ family response regulator
MSAAAPAVAPKTVLVVENEAAVRSPLVKALEFRGFHARGASNVTETRMLVDKLGPQIDVAVLDMRLEDQNYPNLTGANLGQEVRMAHPSLPPEFLIFSGYTETGFYDQAMQLGTAAYLVKANVSQEDLIRHIRSLALRRALNAERKEIGAKVEQIAEKEYSRTAAIKSLCSQVIGPELKMCLGAPSVFLLSTDSGTQNCGGNGDLPSGSNPIYNAIQDLTFGALNNDGPFIFSQQERLMETVDPRFKSIFQKLEGSCFLPIRWGRDMRLSVGILQEEEAGPTSLSEEPRKLADILNSYLRAPIHELLSYLERMEGAIEKTKRKTLLEHTSRFCIYVGQTQLDVLNEAVANKEIEPGKKYFKKLKKLALDLQATGNEFSRLSPRSTEASSEAINPVSVSSVVQRAIEEIKGQFLFEKLELIEKNREESFELAIEQDDLFVAVLRMLQWLAQREEKTPVEVATPRIEIVYVRSNERLEIHFTDQSRRLGAQLRQKMFDPFTQTTAPLELMKDEGEDLPGLYLPLYLAKMIIEKKNNGTLEDRSDELENAHGHLFVMSFPAGGKTDTADDTA